jgi:ubiquinone/menaquinone biosynthesis C-methylase UbiE
VILPVLAAARAARRLRHHARLLWTRLELQREGRRLRPLLADVPAGAAWPAERFRGLSDRDWYHLILLSAAADGARGVLPGFPGPDVQRLTTRAAGAFTLQQAEGIYRLFKDLARRHGREVESCARILDFGCGWGRVLRFFMKDVEPARLWGLDANPAMIEICRREIPWSRFEQCEPWPPTGLEAASFDLVYCFSVFSHLSEPMHQAWLQEFRRILRPGGLLIATTRPRDFIETCRLLRAAPFRPPLLDPLTAIFRDTARWLAAYDAGEYCYEQIAGAWYGEACIPRAYAERAWRGTLEVVEYVADPRRCEQNVIVARREG